MKESMSNRSRRLIIIRVIKTAVVAAACAGVLPGCRYLITNWDQSENGGGNGHFMTIWKVNSVKNYDDIQWGDLSDMSAQLDMTMIPTF